MRVNGPVILKAYSAGTGEGRIRLNSNSPVAYLEYSNDGGSSWSRLGDGTGLDWSATTSYVPGDIVLYHTDGATGAYMCVASVYSAPPGTTAAWRPLTAGTFIYYVNTVEQFKAAIEAAGNKVIVITPASFTTPMTATTAADVTAIYSDETLSVGANITIGIPAGKAVYWHGAITVAAGQGNTVQLASTGTGAMKLGRLIVTSGEASIAGNTVYEAASGSVSGGAVELWDTPIAGLFVPRDLSDEAQIDYSDNLSVYVDDGEGGGKMAISTLLQRLSENRASTFKIDMSGQLWQRPESAIDGYVFYDTDSGNLYVMDNGAWSSPIPFRGAAGTSSYTYVAYAEDAAGYGFSTTPSATRLWRAEITTNYEIAENRLESAFRSYPAVWIKYINKVDSTSGDAVDDLEIDSTLSLTSEHALKNSVITEELRRRVEFVTILPVWSQDTVGRVYIRPDGSVWLGVSDNGTYRGIDITSRQAIDAALDASSSNTVQNRAVYAALQAKQNKLPDGVAGKYLKTTDNGLIWADVSVSDVDLSGYYTSEEIDDLLDAKQEELPIGAAGKYLKKTATGYEWDTPTLGDADNTYDALYDSDVVSSIPASRAVETLNLLCGNMPHMSTKTVVFVPEQDTEAAGMPWSELDESCADGPLLVGHAYQLTLWGGIGVYDGHGYPVSAPLTPDGDTDVSRDPGLDAETVDVPIGYELVRAVEISADEFNGKIAGRYVQDNDGVWGSYNIPATTYHFYNTGAGGWVEPAGEWYAATAPASVDSQEGIVLLDAQYAIANPDGDPWAVPTDTTGWEERASAALQTFVDAHTVWVLRKKPPEPPDDDDDTHGGGPDKPCNDTCTWWYTWKDITPPGGAGQAGDTADDILLISDFLPSGGSPGDVLTRVDGSDSYAWLPATAGAGSQTDAGRAYKQDDGTAVTGQPVMLNYGECYIAKAGDRIAVDTANITTQWGTAWLIVPSSVLESVRLAQNSGILAHLSSSDYDASLEYDSVQDPDSSAIHIKHGRHELIITAGINESDNDAVMVRRFIY